ncbi:MAG: hypothetical protein DKINENOH_01904 [bacterium]|nr:hypothetical protein [bacterium]
MTSAELISAMLERIAQKFQPERVILFGSHAAGEAVSQSDVDLLVILPHVTNKRQTAVAIRRVLADFPIGKNSQVIT